MSLRVILEPFKLCLLLLMKIIKPTPLIISYFNNEIIRRSILTCSICSMRYCNLNTIITIVIIIGD